MRWRRAAWLFRLPFLSRFVGIALAPGLVLSKWGEWDAPVEHWAHEQTHLRQMGELGYPRFLFRYLYECVRFGYWNAPLEVEAREYAGDADLYLDEYLAAREAAGLPCNST